MNRADSRRASASKPPCAMPKSSCPPPGWAARHRSAHRCVRSVASRAVAVGSAVRHRMVEAHEDVRAEPRLVAHRVLGGDAESRAVVRRDERRGVVVDGRDLGEADQLIPAAVGEDRMVPAHERMQPTRALDEVDAGAQREVICVAQQDVDARGAHLVRDAAP